MNKIFEIIALSTILLVGCNGNRTSSNNPNSNVNSTSTSTSSSLSTTIESSNNGDIKYNGYYKATTQSVYFKDVRKSYLFKNDLQSKGDQKILVVPVKFSDSTLADSLPGGSEKVRNDIETMFFGKSEDTGWESVSSYYQKSSYGNLNLTGKVSDWCTLDMTFMQANYLNANDPLIATSSALIAREVGKWYLENYDDANEYDLDQNGYIDALWMVYDWTSNHEYSIDWAHVYWDYTNNIDIPSIENPIPYTYGWAGIGFMYEGEYVDGDGNTLPDAHTFVHETGHLLGLDDYYDSDNRHSYAGCLEMMDYNIGDHNAFSKYLLDWVDPYVVTDDCEITIRPTTETGDFIIVKDEWNHSSTDEYLLIEFYTPTGLNEQDANQQYTENYPKMYQNPGIKIYHIDARLGYFKNYRFSYYTDTILGSESNLAFSTKVAHSNTYSLNESPEKNYLIHLLENNAATTLHGTRVPATDETLFHEGDRFDPINYKQCFKNPEYFNDGEYINYIIDVTSLSNTEATIKFTTL